MIALALLLAGAAAAAWALARYDSAARFLGVAPDAPQAAAAPPRLLTPVPLASRQEQMQQADIDRITALEARLNQVETAAQRVEGSAGRADALLVAFAARRAVDRGVALGFLEPLLVERFGATNPRAVSIIVAGSRTPVRLSNLRDRYSELGPALRSSAPELGWWAEVQQEIGSLISVRRADRPSTQPDVRYRRALEALQNGEVDDALAETMRLPGAGRAQEWTADARRYVAMQRALDEIETAALLGRTRPQGG